MLLSIVIPVLNCGHIIEDALNSIVSQEFFSIEVVLSDGASSDNTLDLASDFLSKHNIAYTIVIQRNSSIYGAMNLAMRVAKGEWLYFMGADDKFISPNILRELTPFFVSSQHNILYGDVWIRALERRWGNGPYTLKSLARWNIAHQATFYRRHALEALDLTFDERYPIEADWDLNLQLWKHVQFHYVDLLIADYAGDGASSKASSMPLYARLPERLLEIYGLRAFCLLPLYRFAETCRIHPNLFYRMVFHLLRGWHASLRLLRLE